MVNSEHSSTGVGLPPPGFIQDPNAAQETQMSGMIGLNQGRLEVYIVTYK